MLFIENIQGIKYLNDTISKCYNIGKIRKDKKEKDLFLICTPYKNEKELIHYTGYDIELLKDNIKWWLHLDNFKIIFNN